MIYGWTPFERRLRSHRRMVAGAHERPVTRSRASDARRLHGRQNAQSPRAVGEGSNVRYAWLRVDGIPTDSIAPALVVIPTNSPRNHSKSNSARHREMRTGLGDQGSQVRVLSPRRARNVSSRRAVPRCVEGLPGANGVSCLTRNEYFSCKRHQSQRLRSDDAATHSKRLWQSSAYIALTVFVVDLGVGP